MTYKLDIIVSFWEVFMAEYSEVVLSIAKRKAMKDFLVEELDRIVHDDVSLASIQQLTNEQKDEFFNNRFEAYLATDEGKALLENAASKIDEAEYFDRTPEQIAEEELRDQWDIAKLESYAIDNRLTGQPDRQAAPATIYDHLFKTTSSDDRQAFFDKHYGDYRNSKEGKAAYDEMVKSIQDDAAQASSTVEAFIEEHKPSKNKARNRAILWTALGVAGLVTFAVTVPVAVGILGSVAAATGAMMVGAPALGLGGAFTALGASNIVKYVRYSRLFRNLRRVATKTDNKGVSLTPDMVNKSVAKVHKLANKLDIVKSSLPKIRLLATYSDDSKPLRVRIADSIRYAVAPTKEQKAVKTAKGVLRKAVREEKVAKRASDQADERLKISNDNIAEMEKVLSNRREADPRLKAEAKQKRMDAAMAKLRSNTADSNVDYAKRQGGIRKVIKARLASGKATKQLNNANIAASDADKAIARNEANIKYGEKRLENLKANNPKYDADAQARKAELDAAKKRREEAQSELNNVLSKKK